MKKIVAMIGILFLTSCASTQVVDNPTLIPLAPVATPKVAPLVMNPVQFEVVNSTGLEDLATTVKSSGQDNVYFILNEQDYKNLMLNLNSINSYIAQQMTVVELLETINQERVNETQLPSKAKTSTTK